MDLFLHFVLCKNLQNKIQRSIFVLKIDPNIQVILLFHFSLELLQVGICQM